MTTIEPTTIPAWAMTKSMLLSLHSEEDALDEACKGLAMNSDTHVEMTTTIAELQKFAHWCLKRYWDQDADIGDAAMNSGLIEEGFGDFDSATDDDAVGDPLEGDEVWYRSTKILGDAR